MRILMLGSAALAALITVGSAQAADLPPKPAPVYKAPAMVQPAFSWTGFYIGINGGGAFGHTDWSYTNGGATASHDTNGGLVGGTVGYNYQFGPNFVAGLEADWDWADINGSATCPNTAFSCQSKIKDIGTFRGRLGWAFDHFLLYGTGGFAWGDVNIQTTNTAGVAQTCTNGGVGATCGTSSTRTGWTAGVGGEYALWQAVSLKVEWLHYDLGSNTFGVDNGLFVSARERGEMVRGGLNYHFN